MQSIVPAQGSTVWIRRSRWRVERVRRDEAIVRLDVANRDRRCTFLMPFDRVDGVGRRIRVRRAGANHACARLAGLIARRVHAHLPSSAIDARIDILPHQLEPALAVLNGARRVLIADEVGLGKTIQAGLIASELRQRNASFRGLLLVPASLRAQWMAELRDRFRVECSAVDPGEISRLAPTGIRDDTPWLGPGLWIATLDYLKQPHVFAALPRRVLDLVIIDEAHSTSGESQRHSTAAALAHTARVLVLLTATPHSGNTADFDRLVDLGALACARDELVVFRRTRADIHMASTRRVRWCAARLSRDEADLLNTLTAFERTVLNTATPERRAAALLLLSVFRKRVLSTINAFTMSVARRLEWLRASGLATPDWIQPTLNFDNDEDDVGSDERSALTMDLGLDAHDEYGWLQRLHTLALRASDAESKLQRLAVLLRRTPEPVVIFTEFRDSLHVIAERLRGIRRFAVVHGGLSTDEQTRELTEFLSGRASALLATDVAGQGLNLQSRARWIINLELPWNPVRLEQRVGRVDRIGQPRDIHVTLLTVRHPAESTLLVHMSRRALAARRALGRDFLRSTLPEETQLRHCLIGNEPLEDSIEPAPVVELCRGWHRPAHSIARSLLSRRALASCWRADAFGDRPISSEANRYSGFRRLIRNGTLLIFVVPILDASGTETERDVVALRTDKWPLCPEIIDEARAVAAGAKVPRARRLQSRRRREAPVLIDREHALCARLASHVPTEWQHGLFDRRVDRERARIAAEADESRAELQAALATVQERSLIEVGRPTLALVFAPHQ